MPKNILKKDSQKAIKKVEKKIESGVDQIIERGRRNSWKNLPKRQVEFIKVQVSQTIESYPPKLRPVVASIMTVCYFSIIPGAGTTSLIIFGTIWKILHKINKKKQSCWL